MRLQRVLLRLQKYDIKVVYKKGTQMYLADTLSRAYPPPGPLSELEMEIDVNMLSHLLIPESILNKLKQAASTDIMYKELSSVIKSGWPTEKEQASEAVADYFNFREEQTI